MIDKVVLAGFGGQGVMFIGKVLAYAGMQDEYNVCWIPSYGPEMRGGTANCSVIIADTEIHSPVIETADFGITLNQQSFEKFVTKIKDTGVMVVNSSIVDVSTFEKSSVEIIAVPAGQIANDLGQPKLANMVCLGALLKKAQLINLNNVETAMKTLVGKRPEMLELNMKAIKLGLDYKL